MSAFRSESMGYFNIVMQKDSAYTILNQIGKIDCVQFIDMTR
jgi:hypothetical protein